MRMVRAAVCQPLAARPANRVSRAVVVPPLCSYTPLPAEPKVIWHIPVGDGFASPVVSGGRVYVGSSDGKLYVIDAATGKAVQEFEAGAPLTASPAVINGRLVIGSTDGKLFALG